MAKKRTVKSNKTSITNSPIKTLVLKKPIRIETLVLKADTLNMNLRQFDLATCKRIVENINIMTHEIHSDADENGGNGIIIGRTLSASIDKKGRVTVVAEVESKFFKSKKVEDFTLFTVGIGASKNGIIVEYDFSCFVPLHKLESASYRGGEFIE